MCDYYYCFLCVFGMASGARGSAWSPGRRRRGGGWCEDSATSDEDLLSDAGIDVEDDEVSNGRRPVWHCYGKKKKCLLCVILFFF